MESSLFHDDLVTSNRIIYTPSLFARANLLHLQEIGILHARKPHCSKRENLASYLFFLVLDGSGTLEYQGKSYPLSQGDCVFIDCKKPYAHYTSEDLWKLQWIHFFGPNMMGIYEKYMERGGLPCFHPRELSAYTHLLDEMQNIAASPSYIKDMKIYEKITSLLTVLMEESWNPKQQFHVSAKRRNLQDIKEYLEEHYAEKITLDMLAERFYINKYYLTRIFKEQFGVSINNYLLQVRITRAKQLLRFSEYSIEKIGQQCGMNDANYFSRMFKKMEGIAPGEYRKQW